MKSHGYEQEHYVTIIESHRADGNFDGRGCGNWAVHVIDGARLERRSEHPGRAAAEAAARAYAVREGIKYVPA